MQILICLFLNDRVAIKSKKLYNYDIKQLEFPLKDYRYEQNQPEITL